jgi:hypothetical protein
MHVMAPRPSDPQVPTFFNVDTSVGERGSNSSVEDILLVQFLIRKVGQTAGPTLPPDRRERMLNVAPTGTCDRETIDGIRAVQETMRERHPATIVDGKVSPARGYQYGAAAWTIVSLNVTVRRHNLKVWPRLHELSDCPSLLRDRFPAVL